MKLFHTLDSFGVVTQKHISHTRNDTSIACTVTEMYLDSNHKQKKRFASYAESRFLCQLSWWITQGLGWSNCLAGDVFDTTTNRQWLWTIDSELLGSARLFQNGQVPLRVHKSPRKWSFGVFKLLHAVATPYFPKTKILSDLSTSNSCHTRYRT